MMLLSPLRISPQETINIKIHNFPLSTHTQRSDILPSGENSMLSIDITLHLVARRQGSQHSYYGDCTSPSKLTFMGDYARMWRRTVPLPLCNIVGRHADSSFAVRSHIGNASKTYDIWKLGSIVHSACNCHKKNDRRGD